MSNTFASCNNCGCDIFYAGTPYWIEDSYLCQVCGASDMTVFTTVDQGGYMEITKEEVITGCEFF